MNSNARTIIKEVEAKATELKLKSAQLEKLKSERKTLEDKKEADELEFSNLEKLEELCKIIIERLTKSSKAKLEEFLTMAVQQIFTDHEYEIQLVFKEDTKKPGLEITLLDNGIGQEITDAVGGGIVSTLGLLLQIFYIESYSLNKTLFIDEGLKEISTGALTQESESINKEQVNYLENLLKFLKWLSLEHGYKFIIVTHDNKVRALADKVYEVSGGMVV